MWKSFRRSRLDPPNPRGRSPYRPVRRYLGLKLLAAGLVLVLAVPSVVDATSLAWRNSDGCRIWGVVDGDTVRMSCPTEGLVRGRIDGFDTPEMKARCPRELQMAVTATFALRWHLWTAKDVVARPLGRDRYDRVLVAVAVDGELVGRRMVDAGLARWYDGGQRRAWCE